nr:FMN-binding protein [uncultured Aminipila sp.]
MSEMHEEKTYSIFQIAMNLTIACLISGIIIAGTYYITNPSAVKNAELLVQKSMQELVKDADNFQPVDGKTDWYAAEKGGEIIAYVVPAESKGYGGAIKMLVAVSKEGTVVDYSITSANETPGLGTNAAEEDFRSEFWGKTSDALIVVKDPTNTKNIQAMTGATISSRAVTKGVKEAVDEVVEFTEGK